MKFWKRDAPAAVAAPAASVIAGPARRSQLNEEALEKRIDVDNIVNAVVSALPSAGKDISLILFEVRCAYPRFKFKRRSHRLSMCFFLATLLVARQPQIVRQLKGERDQAYGTLPDNS